MNKLEALNEVMTTLLRVKNEGQRLSMQGYGYESLCGSVCCVAGWHTFYQGISIDQDVDSAWNNECDRYIIETPRIVSFPYKNTKIRSKVWDILFGTDRPNDIDKQIYVTRWFIRREEALQEYNRIRAMPRKERRLLNLAA